MTARMCESVSVSHSSSAQLRLHNKNWRNQAASRCEEKRSSPSFQFLSVSATKQFGKWRVELGISLCLQAGAAELGRSIVREDDPENSWLHQPVHLLLLHFLPLLLLLLFFGLRDQRRKEIVTSCSGPLTTTGCKKEERHIGAHALPATARVQDCHSPPASSVRVGLRSASFTLCAL